jgi:hypothetical protein
LEYGGFEGEKTEEKGTVSSKNPKKSEKMHTM